MDISINCDEGKTALAIFSYNRPHHLHQLYQKILHLELSGRYCFHLFNDGPKKIKSLEITAVQELTDDFSRKVSSFTLVRRHQNLGLANSIHFGMDLVFECHSQSIVLEDDIIPNQQFFETMDFYLDHLKNYPKVGSITGANPAKFPILETRNFLACRRHSSWGWATWADRWLAIDWHYAEIDFLKDDMLIRKVKRVSPDLVRYAELKVAGEIDSWATTMNIDFIKRDLLCIVPKRNLIKNIGLDGSGTHAVRKKYNRIPNEKEPNTFLKFELAEEIKESFFYNLRIRKQNSLLRDFPKGTLFRLILKTRTHLTRLQNRNYPD